MKEQKTRNEEEDSPVQRDAYPAHPRVIEGQACRKALP